jgi:DNA polymerase-4
VTARTILHADLDAFYASAEQLDDPSLRGKPVIVGGDARRGVVLAASYEVRPLGVRSAMPMARALRLAPRAIVRPPRFERYRELSGQFFEVLSRFSPHVEPLSLDEAFLDATGEERLLGTGPQIAQALRAAVRAEVGLAVSVGVAPSKFVAKIASDLAKPDGMRVVEPGLVTSFLHPLPVERLWGVGKVTAGMLHELGLATIGDLAGYPEDALVARFGESGAHLAALSRGEDERPVVPEREPVSVGHEDTFAEDLRDPDALRRHLLEQADRVAARLRRHGLRARTVVLKVKLADFRILTRRRTLPEATSDGTVLGRLASELLAQLDLRGQAVRLTGVSATGLARDDAPEQLGFEEGRRARGEKLGRALDRIAEKYGPEAMRRAVTIEPDPHGGTPSPRPQAPSRRSPLKPPPGRDD